MFPSLARFSKASIVFKDLKTYLLLQLTDITSFIFFLLRYIYDNTNTLQILQSLNTVVYVLN